MVILCSLYAISSPVSLLLTAKHTVFGSFLSQLRPLLLILRHTSYKQWVTDHKAPAL